MNPQPRYTSLRDYLAVVRQRRVLVVFITLVFTGAAIGLTVNQTPVYQAEASILFKEPSEGIAAIGVPEFSRQTPQDRAATKAETATRQSILDGAARRLGGRVNLAGRIGARAEVRTNFVVILARDSDARLAARAAQAVADELIEVTDNEERAHFDKLISRTRARLSQTFRGSSPLQQARRSEIQTQLVRLETARDIIDPAELARAAGVPRTPVSPKPVRTGLIGFLVGLSFGVLAAFLRDALDRRLRGSRDIARESGYPVLALVRSGALGKANIGDPLDSGSNEEIDLESFRILRTNLEFLDVDKPVKSVVVTSPLPEEGKSTVAASLAVASALAGRRVLLVEADLRRPVLAKRLNIPPAPGLTDYLAGRVGPSEVLQVVALNPPDGGNGTGPSMGADPHSLVVITAGTTVPRPAELLASERMGSFIEDVAGVYDLVVFDTSPLLPVVDTLELVPRVDAVILCVRSERTTREQLRGAREALGRLPERPVGIVVTGVRKGGEGEYGYYSYSYAYTGAS